MNVHSLFFIFCGLFLLTGCSISNNSKEVETNKEQGFITPEYSVAVPASWEIYPKEEYPATILFAARQNVFSTSIPASISISTIQSKPESLEIFVAKNLESVRKKSQDLQVVSQTNVSDSSAEKMLVEYSERNASDYSRIGFFALYVLPKNISQSYVVTMLFDGTISSSEKEELQKIVGSFTLKK